MLAIHVAFISLCWLLSHVDFARRSIRESFLSSLKRVTKPVKNVLAVCCCMVAFGPNPLAAHIAYEAAPPLPREARLLAVVDAFTTRNCSRSGVARLPATRRIKSRANREPPRSHTNTCQSVYYELNSINEVGI